MSSLHFAQKSTPRRNDVMITPKVPTKSPGPGLNDLIIGEIRRREKERRGPQPLHDEISEYERPSSPPKKDDDRGSVTIIPGENGNLIKPVYECSDIRANEILPPERRVPRTPRVPLPVGPGYEIPGIGPLNPDVDPMKWRKPTKDPKHEIN
ncbi:hypothetical protein HY990_05685 [Candidatus Micrarchaeota archaeon]|nr:hypothetical protein [Candidatus Micrarchaeota archaeon]